MGQPDETVKDETAVEEPVIAADTIQISADAPAAQPPEAAAEKIRIPFRLAGIVAPFAARPRLSRVAVLALSIAISAAAGSAVGAMAAVAFVKPQPVSSDNARTIEVNSLRGVITQLSAEVASLKASIDNTAKQTNAAMAKVAERVERAEKAQAEPASRVLKLSEMLERIDRRTAAAPALASASPEITGSIALNTAAPKQQDRPAVVNGWVIRDVFDGRAMIENDRLGFYEVVPGANVPGLGRVESIRRQDGRWVVVTPKGLIVSSR